MDKKINFRKVERVGKVVGFVILLITAIYSIDKYFAKDSKVQGMNIDLQITKQDGIITQQQHDIDRYKAMAEFEPKQAETDATIKAIIHREEEKLEQLKEDRKVLVQRKK